MAEKVILDTDIGTNVDDAWALALCLASGEIDFLGVTLVQGDLDMRAKIASKMLELAGRANVPAVKDDQADFILSKLEHHAGEVTICCIGPLTNIAEAIRRAPGTMRRVKGLAIMGTTFNGEGPDAAALERNSSTDPAATYTVLSSGIPAYAVGLNVTRRVSIDRNDARLLRGSPLGDYLASMTEEYLDSIGTDSTFMNDPLAVATVIDPSIATFEPMRAEILDDSRVAYMCMAGSSVEVAVDADVPGFRELLTSRLLKS